ncbi:MAG: hypothetical protein AB8B87_19370 [Granulosicoccus sp.]
MTLQTIAFITDAVPVLEQYGRSNTDFSQHPDMKNNFITEKQRNEEQSHSVNVEALSFSWIIENPGALLPNVSRITHKHSSSDAGHLTARGDA